VLVRTLLDLVDYILILDGEDIYIRTIALGTTAGITAIITMSFIVSRVF
jgi:hypothetical protein